MSNSKLAFILLGAAGVAVAAPADTPKTGVSPQFPSEISLVTVDAVVLDDAGNPVRGLGKDDFVLTENGQPQSITTFEAIVTGAPVSEPKEPPPPPPPVSTNVVQARQVGRTFVIVFDGVHLTPEGALHAKDAIAHFLKDGVREGDTVGLLSTANGMWWSGRGARDRDHMLQLLAGLRGERIDVMPSGVYISDDEARRIAEDHDALVSNVVWKRLKLANAVFEAPTLAPTGGSMTDGTAQAQISGDVYRFHPEVEAYARTLYDAIQKRRRATLDVLRRVLDSLTTRTGRKSVLLVSEGFVADDTTPGFREVIEVSRRANTAVYFLDARGLVASTGDPNSIAGQVVGDTGLEAGYIVESVGSGTFDVDADSAGADQIADQTGGFSVKRANDLTKGFDRVGRESAAYYLIGYHPTDERHDGSYRKISVSVSRKGVHLRARKGYYAPEPSGKRRKDKSEEQDAALPVLQRAVDAPFPLESVPLRVSAYVMGNAGPTQANVVVATDIDIRDLAFDHVDDRYVDRLSFFAVALNMQTGERFKSNQKIAMRLTKATREGYTRAWYPALADLQLPAGPYQLKVVVVDENNERAGSVVHEFDVPDLSRWRISTPVLSDALFAPKEGARPQPVPLARRAFAAQGRLFCQFSVHGAAANEGSHLPEVVAGFALQDANGREIFRGDPAAIQPDADGSLARLIGVPLKGLAPGDYSLLLTFEDKVAGQHYERREPLTIAAD